jgi:4,5-DOPA dioxygenase extradiol
MAIARMPTLFISHGSPMLAVVDSAARRFLAQLGPKLAPPTAVVVVSAHYDTPMTEVTAGDRPETIHDFGGFPEALYRLRYPAPGSPELARDIVGRLEAVGMSARLAPLRGLDHGAWIPLSLMLPRADVPVLQVSINSRRSPEEHFALGRALRSLRDLGTLVLGSGGATHNLALYARAHGRDDDSTPPEWVEAFNEWTAGAVAARRLEDLFRYAERAPYAAQNHPTAEHYLPLFVTLGAAHDDEPGVRIHSSYDRGLLSLDAYAFGVVQPITREIRVRATHPRPAVLH